MTTTMMMMTMPCIQWWKCILYNYFCKTRKILYALLYVKFCERAEKTFLIIRISPQENFNFVSLFLEGGIDVFELWQTAENFHTFHSLSLSNRIKISCICWHFYTHFNISTSNTSSSLLKIPISEHPHQLLEKKGALEPAQICIFNFRPPHDTHDVLSIYPRSVASI